MIEGSQHNRIVGGFANNRIMSHYYFAKNPDGIHHRDYAVFKGSLPPNPKTSHNQPATGKTCSTDDELCFRATAPETRLFSAFLARAVLEVGHCVSIPGELNTHWQEPQQRPCYIHLIRANMPTRLMRFYHKNEQQTICQFLQNQGKIFDHS